MISLIAYLSLVTLTLHAREQLPTGDVALNTCTAVYVGPHTALTAAHCLEHNKDGKMWVRTSNGHSYSASFIAGIKRTDIALIDVHGPDHVYAELGYPVYKSQPVYIVSSEDDMPETYAQGIVENIIVDRQTNTPMIVHSAGIVPGASGSGLFDARGRLIGINTLSYKTLSLAVDLGPIKRFLEDVAQRKALHPA